jgi:hypothetical protein
MDILLEKEGISLSKVLWKVIFNSFDKDFAHIP